MVDYSSKALMQALLREYEHAIERSKEDTGTYGKAWDSGYENGIRSAIAVMTGTHHIPTPSDGGVPDWIPAIKEWIDA